MGRTFQRYPFQSVTYTGQTQNQYDFNAAGRFAALVLQIEGQADTAAGTAAPHAAQVMNIIDELEIYDNKANSFVKLSGPALDYLFRFKNGVSGENLALAAGAATNAAFRHYLELPFELLDGLDPQDTHMESVTKDLKVRVKYNNPIAAGTMFGTPSTMNLDNLTINMSVKQYDMPPSAGSTPARGLKENIINIPATNDAFKVELDKGTEFRGVTIVTEQLVGGVWTPDATVYNANKNLALKGTANNRTYQAELMRVYRNETLQRRQAANVPAGVVDVPFIAHGRAGQNLVSDQTNQLYLEVPVVKQTGDCRLRVIFDTLMSQVPGTN